MCDKPIDELTYRLKTALITSVFLRLVDEVIDRGEGAIIMVPEISLTPQTVAIFGNRYGKKVALF